MDESRIILVIDDTATCGRFSASAMKLSRDIVVLPAPPRAAGGHGGLWVKLAAGYRQLLANYEPAVIVRLDVDALIIGYGLERRAMEQFALHPETGLLGSYRTSADGGLRDWSYAARRLKVETGLRGMRSPSRRALLRSIQGVARGNGYLAGEHVLGGSYIHSIQAADAIFARGWFDLPSLATSKLGEDHIMSLLTVAAGYRIRDFGRPTDPMALRWRGLPAHPEDLLNGEKLVTHSVRYWQNMEETAIRHIFKEGRISNFSTNGS